MTFDDLSGLSTVARGLLARGVDGGDQAAIWSPNTHHWIVGALATQTIGATIVTVNYALLGAGGAST